MPVQTPQWSEFLSCPVCQNDFETTGRVPVSLTCGHTVCKNCLLSLQRNQCPFDQNQIGLELTKLPVNTALLQLIGNGDVPNEHRSGHDVPSEDIDNYQVSTKLLEDLALFLKPSQSSQLSRPMQRKLITLVTCQLLQDEGRSRGVRSARSLGERSVTELILQHQNPQQLSANLWAAVRARGCQFLGPAMQEEVLKLVLLALEEGSALSRKVLVMFVVQRLEPHFPQASKTSIGHVVQLLYRASCFKVTKRDGDSSLMQLKDEFRTYDNLRREHDTQIVQIATEGGLRIAPDQWSSLLYGDSVHKSHMQSIIDKLQTPQSFGQSVQELVIALQRTGDPGRLSCLRPHLDILTSIDPSSESEVPSWELVVNSLKAAHVVVGGLVTFCNLTGAKKTGETYNGHLTRFKTNMCRDLATHGSCPRGQYCTFAHTQSELEFHRNGSRNRAAQAEITPQRSREKQFQQHYYHPHVSPPFPPPPSHTQHCSELPPSLGQPMPHPCMSLDKLTQLSGQHKLHVSLVDRDSQQADVPTTDGKYSTELFAREQTTQGESSELKENGHTNGNSPGHQLRSDPEAKLGHTNGDLELCKQSADHQLTFCGAKINNNNKQMANSSLTVGDGGLANTNNMPPHPQIAQQRPIVAAALNQYQQPAAVGGGTHHMHHQQLQQHHHLPVQQLINPQQQQQTTAFVQEMTAHIHQPVGPPAMGGQAQAANQVSPARNNQQLLMVPSLNTQTQVTPIVDANGSPMIDIATGQPLVAAHTPLLASPVQLPDGSIIPVQQNSVQIANIQVAQNNNMTAVAINPIIMPQQQSIVNLPAQQDVSNRRFSHEISPDIATKSLSALKDRKEEIISELGDIVGPTAAKAIGDITFKQAAGQKFGMNHLEPAVNVKQSSPVDNRMAPRESENPSLYGMWTSKPLVTISTLKKPSSNQANNSPTNSNMRPQRIVPAPISIADSLEDDEYKPLPEGACVSRFGPISRRNVSVTTERGVVFSEPWSVTARNTGNGTVSTRTMKQPLASASAVPDNIMLVTDQSMLFDYRPGNYSDFYMEGMDSVSMQHLVNPPILPASPMPNPRDQQTPINSQNLSMFAESNRIQKELQDLQRRISCLSVAENSAQMAMKRDRLAFELRMVEGGIQERRQGIDDIDSIKEKDTQYSYW